ncbi:MAG: helix-turn-helix transcriptional regulator [Acidimicrobiales bacterium]
MRADRLIALLLLLQRRGRITAAEAAEELEVSARTARRDLEALAMSGVPVYSTHGRGGGWELIGGASTDLTGLSGDEARALFLAAGPAVTATPELKSALQKLTSALPTPFQAEAQAATTAFKIDASGWGQVGQPSRPRFFESLTDAVVQGRQAKIDYQGRSSDRRWRTVHPLGLVTKRNVWYLVAGVQDETKQVEIRTYRLSRVQGVEVLDLDVVKPASFSLDEAWDNIVTEVERQRATTRITALVEPSLLGPLRWVFGQHQRVVQSTEPTSPDDLRVRVTIDAHTPRSFAGQIAGFADGVELLDAPDEVLAELAELADKLHAAYGSRP